MDGSCWSTCKQVARYSYTLESFALCFTHRKVQKIQQLCSALLTHFADKSGTVGQWNAFSLHWLRNTSLYHFLYNSTPLIIHYLCLMAAKISEMPSWYKATCLPLTKTSVKWCLFVSNIRFFILHNKSDWFRCPLQVKWLSLKNYPF